MSSKIKSNKKSGFTLVELVIVIAILAVLAAIAIPIISTTINSAKMSAMESDRSTLNLLLKTAVTELENSVKPTTYNHSAVNSNTKIDDVLYENNLNDIDFTRTINGSTFYMVWTGKSLEISQNPAHLITGSTTLATLTT